MSLSEIALNAGRANNNSGKREAANIIDFVESPWGLDLRLFPVQRVILKAHYGIALDTKEKRIHVSDFRRESYIAMTEAEYLKHLFDEGRCNIREIEEGKERREMVLAIGRRSGKCILGDSLVLTSRGILPILDLGDAEGPEYQPMEIGVAQEGSKKSVSKYFYNGGTKHVNKIKTRCGYELGGTDNHRIKVMTEEGTVQWRYMSDLKVGDSVCLHRNTDLWASEYVDLTNFHDGYVPGPQAKHFKDTPLPAKLDESWGLLLGALVGDGSWTLPRATQLTCGDPEALPIMQRIFEDTLGETNLKLDKRTEGTYQIQHFGVKARHFLNNIGWTLGCAKDAKRVPWSILQSPKPVVAAFLKALFETDGGVESEGKVVSFCSASKRLTQDVQTLLLNFGIVSRVKEKRIKNRPDSYWVLTIRGLRSRRVFANRIGFLTDRKNRPLLENLQKASREGGDAESIPHQKQWCVDLLRSIKPNYGNQNSRNRPQGWSRSHMRTALGNTCKPASTENITYPRLANVLAKGKELGASEEILGHFEHLVELDYFYDPIVSIEEGLEPVFDLSVPDGVSFVANGMTNHNTLLSSCIAAYETYKLICKNDPQEYYGLPSSNPIQIISVATDKDQAGLLYQEVSGHYQKCPFFSPYTANNTQSYARFQTPKDIEKTGSYKTTNRPKPPSRLPFAHVSLRVFVVPVILSLFSMRPRTLQIQAKVPLTPFTTR
jgi:intein/homing endonuclease